MLSVHSAQAIQPAASFFVLTKPGAVRALQLHWNLFYGLVLAVALLAGGQAQAIDGAGGKPDYERQEHEQDPWESFNRPIFRFNNFLDTWFLRPIAAGYRNVTPDAVDRSVSNVYNNIGDVVSLANSILQLKHKQAAVTASRLMFNSIFGLAGIFDVATDWGLPRQREDFGQTLVYWGVPEGNYLMLPFLGSATVTDAFGRIPDALIDPLNRLNEPGVYFATFGETVDQRAGVIPGEHLIVGDEYVFLRNAYLQQRNYLVNDGRVVSDPFLSDDF